MMDLEDMLAIKGVVAAFRYNDDGSLAESAGGLDLENASLAAQLCYSNGRISHQNSDLLMTISGMAGWPPQGWMMLGNRLSICTRTNVVCFVSNSEVSFNEVFHALDELGHE